MPDVTKSLLAEEIIIEFPDSSDRQIARMLYKQYPTAFRNFDAARRVVQYVRGHSGKRDRNKRKGKVMPRTKKLQCPDSLSEPWVPYEFDASKVLVLSDEHIPFHDRKAIEAAVEYGIYRGVNGVLLNGDAIDFTSISRFQRRPDRRDSKVEVDILKEYLTWLRSKFPRNPILFKKGNHENWWDKMIWDKAPEIWKLREVQLEHVLGLDTLRIPCIGDQAVLLGKLAVFHGHELGKGTSSPACAARNAFLKVLDSVMVGHHHVTSTYPASNWKHEEMACWSTGCLCTMYPEYARINKWNQGAAVVMVDRTGNYDVTNFRIEGKNYAIRTS